MSRFKGILQELGIASVVDDAKSARDPGVHSTTTSRAAPTTAPASAPITFVNVEALLDQKAAASGTRLNWRKSIVDLLKLLGADSSLTARKELAQELACPPELMNNSADMNIWLHKEVLTRIAENGGKVPVDLLERT